MRALLQRVARASVRVDGVVTGTINSGLLALIGITHSDTAGDIDWLCRKIAQLRIFEDETGVMNRSLLDTGGELLAVSQFTLYASTKKGNRPSYSEAARPEVAQPLFEAFVAQMSATLGRPVPTGIFGAMMDVELINQGPVTIWLDSGDSRQETAKITGA